MDELIYLLIKLIVKGFESAGRSRQQPDSLNQARLAWEQQQRLQAQTSPPPAPKPLKRQTQKRIEAPRAASAAAAPPARITSAAEVEDVFRLSRSGGRPAAGPSLLSGLANPRSLRERFVLTEILRPPVALRPRRI